MPAALPQASALANTFPAGFVENRGQLANEAILFYAQAQGSAVYFLRDGLVLDRWSDDSPAARPHDPREREEAGRQVQRSGNAVRIRFAGGASGGTVEGVEHRAATYNYYIGDDPRRWRAGVPLYATVLYREILPGLDLTYSVDGDRLQCTAIQRPGGSDPSLLGFVVEGAGGDILERDGSILLGEPGDDSVAGAVGGARDDATRLLWSTFLGGTAEEAAWSVAVDRNDGSVLVTGTTFSSSFPTTPGSWDQTYTGLGDVFVSKLSSDGRSLIWSTFLGGSSMQFDQGYGIAVDPADGYPIVTGYTWSSDFPTTVGAYDRSFNGVVDAFVSKFSAETGGLVWSTFVGGQDVDIAYAIDLDSEGNPLIAGRTLSFDYPATPGAYDESANGEEDVFVTALGATGANLLWSTYIGGGAYDGASAIELDRDDQPVIVGHSSSADYPGGEYAGGLYDVILTKLTPHGDGLVWSRMLGGGSYDFGNDVAIDLDGNALACGATGSFDFPVTAGAYDESYNADDDAYVAKVDGATGELLWATFLGGTTPVYETAFGIDVDGSNRPVVAGATPSADFPVTPNGYDTSQNGGSDVFVARLGSGGETLEWSTFLGAGGDDYGWDVVMDGQDGAIVAGAAGPDFPSTAGAYDASYNGDISDAFVAKLDLRTETGCVTDDVSGNCSVGLSPNPMAGGRGGAVSFSIPAAGSAAIDVIDLQGRRCARVMAGDYPSGSHVIEWKARDDRGRLLPAGRYYLRLAVGDQKRLAPITIVR
ncbi:MAG: SBBP repeat-containing protein [Candidatus Eisenbacteria bacterium]